MPPREVTEAILGSVSPDLPDSDAALEYLESFVCHLGWLRHPPGDEVAQFLAEGWFEYREQAFCWLYLREGDTVLDVGASFGLYSTLAAALCGETGRVVAVEPNPAITPLLAANLSRSAGKRGELIAAALGSRTGEVEFFPGTHGRAAYSSTVAETTGATACRVPCVTMTALCHERSLTRVTLAKLDVEGDELEVLRGAREAISQGTLPLWMIEFAEGNLRRRDLGTRALFDELVSLGYTVCRFDERSRRLVPVKWTGPVWYDNYFAATSIDEVNQRLSMVSAERSLTADDILRRGVAATALREAAAEAARQRDESGTRAQQALHQAAREAELIQIERAESARLVQEAQTTAEVAERRAQEANAHLEESWRRVGEANWRADQATKHAVTAGEHAEGAYRRLDVADRRTANARYEAQLLKTRLRELLLDPHRPRRFRPAWAKSFLAGTEGLTPPDSSRSDQSDPMQRTLYHLAGKNFRPHAVLDVGAGKGYWSLNAHTFFPEAEYYMADPLSEHEDDLRVICAKDARFRFVKTAVGDEDGTVEINVTPGLFDSHCLPHPAADPAMRRRVPQRSADSLLREGCIAAPSLVKIDVQGYELKVLAGAEHVLKTTEVLVIEVSLFRFMQGAPLAHEVIGALAASGFVLYDVAGSLRRPFEDDLGQLDLVFVSTQSRLIESTRWD